MTLSGKEDKTCLTINCCDIIPNGPGKFSTNADNEKGQFCYFNEKTKDRLCNLFLSKRLLHPHEIRV